MQNPIKDQLAANQPSIGSWLNLASPLAAEVMAAAGFEWLVVDAEHSPFDLGHIAHTFRAIEARGAIPMARAWDHDPVTAARLLDAGAWGLVFPHVSTPAQAEKIAQAMRYPPRGQRSVGTGRCVTISPDYRKSFDDAVLLIPQIEDMEGIENAEAIARVEGVDIGFLGPGDLAMSMGVEAGHPDHEAALQAFREGCERAGKPCGIPVKDTAAAKQRIAEGFQLIDINNDLRFLEAAAQKAYQEAAS
ncbi:MAG: aldolase/citrate lyase family protein [Candidatus Latescibacterota bacterium]|nr:aldolase/citrate lyase family protein [Candidatus Latescibacterota bacterium]